MRDTPLLPKLAILFVFSGVAYPVFAPQPPLEPSAQDRMRMSEEYLHTRLKGWQKRLKLDQWSVVIRMSRPSELRHGTKGSIKWDANKRKAVIRVLDAESYPMPYQSMLNDMEFTVVHELIHLQLSSLPRSEASRTDEEYAVNRITEALLDLDRSQSKPAAHAE